MSSLLQFVFWCKRQPEAGHRDIAFVTVLFEEHPLQHFGAASTVGRQQGCVLGQLPRREFHAELARGEPDFVAIAGHLHLMKHGHVKNPRERH
jgi:hypothetical protein